MRAFLAAALALCLSAAARPAGAADVERGLGASLRVAYGVPVGKLADSSGADVDRMFRGTLPVQLDLGYRFHPAFAAAIFGQYGFGFVASGSNSLGAACSSTAMQCSTTDLRLGAEFLFHPLPGRKYEPWFGLGMAYEWAKFSAERSGVSSDATIRGFEFLDLQGGLDFTVRSGFGFGPFVQFTLGQYSHSAASATTAVTSGGGVAIAPVTSSVSGDIPNKSVHSWLQFGMRGTFNL